VAVLTEGEQVSKEMLEDPASYFIGVGIEQERERIIKLLEDYLDLTKLPGDKGVEENLEWDAGFQAAMSLVRGHEK
jgi:signal transduction histidine kinase